MNYTGLLFCLGHRHAWGKITRATLTANTLSLRWHEGTPNVNGHIEAEANNGLVRENMGFFEGKFNYSSTYPGNPFDFSLRRYTSENGWVLLFGTYRSDTTDEEGTWTFVLQPADVIEQAKS